jgi:hypothetical protein
MSVRRWGSRDSFRQPLLAATNEIETMPERMAKTPGTEQIRETVGSGPFRFLPDQWVSGVSAAYARFDGYVPRQESPSFLAGGKAANVQRVEWVVQPDPVTAAAALRTGEVDLLEVPLIDLYAAPVAGRAGLGERSVWLAAQPYPAAVQQPEAATGAAAGDQPKDVLGVGDRGPDRPWPSAVRLFHRKSADVEPCRARCPVRTARRRHSGDRVVCRYLCAGWLRGWCGNPVTPERRS